MASGYQAVYQFLVNQPIDIKVNMEICVCFGLIWLGFLENNKYKINDIYCFEKTIKSI